MTDRIRASEIRIFVAFVLFMLPCLAIQNVRDPLPTWQDTVRLHPEIGAALSVLDIAGLFAVLAILVGGIPILWATFQQAIRARRRDVPLLLLSPFAAIATLASYVLLTSGASTMRAQNGSPDAPFTPLALALQFGLVALFLVAVAGGTGAVALAIARSELSERLVRFALAPAAIASVAIGVGVMAWLALTVLIWSEAPRLNSPGVLPFIAAPMIFSLVIAVSALLRGLAAWRGATLET